MSSKYNNFLKHLFVEHVQPRRRHAWEYWNPSKYPWHHVKSKLKKECSVLRYINEHCATPEEVHQTFHHDRLEALVDEVREYFVFHQRILDRSGILGCLDCHYDEIANGLNIKMFSESEIDLLRDFGSTDPVLELKGIIYTLKRRKKRREWRHEGSSIRDRLAQGEKALHWAEKELDREAYPDKDEHGPEKKSSSYSEKDKDDIEKSSRGGMRLFKGLAKITSGTALSLGDVALMIGATELPAAQERVFISTTTGIEKILEGIGELKGE